MFKTIKGFYTCSTCELKEQDDGCDHKRMFCLDRNKNYQCSDWRQKNSISKFYIFIVKILNKFNYYSY